MKKCLGDVSYLEKNENELWRACRRHGVALDDDGNPIEPIRPAEPGDNGYIPFTIGGSDIGAIAGDSHFAAKTPLSVYNKKLGLVEEGKIDEMLALIGHSLEDGVAQITLGELKKIFGDGVELIQDGNLSQNTEHPWNLIDMDRLSVGHPMLEISDLYYFYVVLGEEDPKVVEDFMGFSYETAKMFFDYFLEYYLDTGDEKALQEMRDKADLICCIRMINKRHKNQKLTKADREVVDRYIQRLSGLLDRIDTLA